VNDRFETGIPGIYAAGDVLAGPRHAGHWVTAMRQGSHAALSMIGRPIPHREVPFFWSDIGEETVKFVGHPVGSEPVPRRGDIDSGDFMAVWESEGKTTGGLAVGFDRELIALEQKSFGGGP
jgi:NADPH-dependent 2,4-dienoyl-CoA reductase/sulfur reductase-like enzyme